MDTYGSLPLPVVIPQQRPGSKERGFIAAYAPSLEACGIDRMTFLHFIDKCNAAFQGSKFLVGVQVVSLGVGFTPEAIAMGVAAGVQLGAQAANKVNVRHKTNQMLNKYNEELFGPRGLFCMIMSYQPDIQVDYSQSSNPLGQLGSMARVAGKGIASKWFADPISGRTQGSQNMPTAVAPLMYVDDRREHKKLILESSITQQDKQESISDPYAAISKPMSTSSKKKKPNSVGEKAKRAKGTVDDYLDRRARARYAAENSDSILNVPLTRGFKYSFLDPNHPASNGGLKGLLSNGMLTQDPAARQRNQMNSIMEEKRQLQEEYNERVYDIRNQDQSPYEIQRQLKYLDRDYGPQLQDLRNRKMAITSVPGGERHIKKDILYLVIVNRPSDSQLAEADARLHDSRNHGMVSTVEV